MAARQEREHATDGDPDNIADQGLHRGATSAKRIRSEDLERTEHDPEGVL
jgi:hypothetical protein